MGQHPGNIHVPAKDAANPKCRVFGHFHHTLYQRWLTPYAAVDAARFQMVEIGFSQGHSYELWHSYLPRGEVHSLDYNENAARTSGRFEQLRQANLLHIGDTSDFVFLNDVYNGHLRRKDA